MDFDPEKLKQALSNLLSNAIRFTPDGGEVTLECSILNVEFSILNDKPEGLLKMMVKDNGIGIRGDQLPHIFDRFYQVDDTATRKGEGTGIGLTLTKELVQLMGGQILVKSEIGKGSEFSIVLPVTQNASPAGDVWDIPVKKAAAAPSPKPPAAPLVSDLPRVLIVEDHVDVAAYIQKCLTGSYAVMMAPDGKTGFDKARAEIPDLVISDVMMPEMDGYGLTRALKDDLLTCHIPVILLTAKADVGSRIEGWEKGADEYLAKPFHEEELRSRIRNLLEIRRKLQERYKAGSKPASTKPLSDDPLVRRVIQLVERDFTVQWEAESLAAALFVSQTQLYRKLKSTTSMHITEFVRYLRLQEAARLLTADREKKIAAIAYEVGFSTPQEFSRRFKELFEVTPGEWRLE
jgi:DNA-binding response OmpR family regulator